MTTIKILQEAGRPAVEVVLASLDTTTTSTTQPPRDVLALATRYLLQLFAEVNPGHAVEVRVPPFGAVQAVEGPRHTRGTPANVVELAPLEWVQLATGAVSWTELAEDARVSASGVRSDIRALLPLAEW